MRLANLAWPKVESYFKKSDTVLLAVGSIECHGRHMPLGTDTFIPDRLLELFEEKNKEMLILPTLPYGSTDSLEPFPGTISIGYDALYIVLRKIIDSIKSHGARKFIILNGHGGNTPVIERLGMELDKEGCLLAMLNWWQNVMDLDPSWSGGHGDGEETAAIMGVDPSLIDKNEIDAEVVLKDLSPRLKAKGFNTVEFSGVKISIPRVSTKVMDNGWTGPLHPRTATVEWGDKMLKAMADFIVDFAAEFEKLKV